jgi:nicotinamidase-related amidase
MPITKLDPVTALVVIDLQRGIVSLPTVHPVQEVIGNAATLARSFRARRLPVVLVNVTGAAPGRTDAPRRHLSFPPEWTELVPELQQQPSDYLVSKQRFGAFLGTDLDPYLRHRAATQIVLAGISTSLGVESTGRCAYDLGYNVTFAIDAMTDRDPDVHRNCVEKIFPRLGESDTTADVLRLLNSEG